MQNKHTIQSETSVSSQLVLILATSSVITKKNYAFVPLNKEGRQKVHYRLEINLNAINTITTCL